MEGASVMDERDYKSMNSKEAVVSKTLYSVKKNYSIILPFEGNLYFYIVVTMECPIRTYLKEEIVEVYRNNNYLDCGKRLKTSEKKKIRKQIEQLFNE